MSGRWWLGLMAAGLTSTCLIVGCDSNDDDDDNTDDPAPAGNTDTAPVDGAFSGTRADADSTAAIAFNFNQNGEVLLIPHNPAYEPIDGTHATILGKVTAVLRRV